VEEISRGFWFSFFFVLLVIFRCGKMLYNERVLFLVFFILLVCFLKIFFFVYGPLRHLCLSGASDGRTAGAAVTLEDFRRPATSRLRRGIVKSTGTRAAREVSVRWTPSGQYAAELGPRSLWYAACRGRWRCSVGQAPDPPSGPIARVPIQATVGRHS